MKYSDIDFKELKTVYKDTTEKVVVFHLPEPHNGTKFGTCSRTTAKLWREKKSLEGCEIRTEFYTEDGKTKPVLKLVNPGAFWADAVKATWCKAEVSFAD